MFNVSRDRLPKLILLSLFLVNKNDLAFAIDHNRIPSFFSRLCENLKITETFIFHARD